VATVIVLLVAWLFTLLATLFSVSDWWGWVGDKKGELFVNISFAIMAVLIVALFIFELLKTRSNQKPGNGKHIKSRVKAGMLKVKKMDYLAAFNLFTTALTIFCVVLVSVFVKVPSMYFLYIMQAFIAYVFLIATESFLGKKQKVFYFFKLSVIIGLTVISCLAAYLAYLERRNNAEIMLILILFLFALTAVLNCISFIFKFKHIGKHNNGEPTEPALS
jgi:MFS family permease